MSEFDKMKKNLEDAVENIKESEITAEVINAAHEMKDEAIIAMDKVREKVMTEDGKLDKENISRMANNASKTVADTFEKAKETLLTDENKENLSRMADTAMDKAEDLADKVKGFFKK